MTCRQLSVRGLILDGRNHDPVPNLHVELWGQRSARSEPVLLSAGRSLADGAFGLLFAEPQLDRNLASFRLVLREPDGREIQAIEGPTSWSAGDPPHRIVLHVQAERAMERTCAPTPTLRREFVPLQSFPNGTSADLRAGGSSYVGDTGRIVGRVQAASGRGLGNLRIRLTARPVGASVDAPEVGDYPDPTREIELARTYTHGSDTGDEAGTYEIIWPLDLPATTNWRGQGWWEPNGTNPSLGWQTPDLIAPYLLILYVEAPTSTQGIDLALPPGWNQPYDQVAARTIRVQKAGDHPLLVQDFLLHKLSLPEDTEFADLSSVLSPFEHAFFRGVGSGDEGAVNPDFDAADLVVLAEGVEREVDQVAAWLLAHKLSYELAGAANRSKNVLSSAIPLATHQAILSPEVCYGLVRSSGQGSTFAMLAMPLAVARDHLCLAVHRRQISTLNEDQLTDIQDLLWHAGVGAQILDPHSTTIPSAVLRENSLLALLSASDPDPSIPPSGTSTGAQARMLAVHRIALLGEQLQRATLPGPTLPEAELWSTDPSSPPFDNGEPLNNSVWNLARNNLDFFGEEIDDHGNFGAELAFFERCADNARLGRIMFRVSVAIERFWTSATNAHDLAEMAIGAIEALATDDPPATLPDAFVHDGVADPTAWAEHVHRGAKRAWWSRGLRGLFTAAGGDLSDFESGLPADFNLRRARLKADDMPGADDETKRANLREALRILRRAKLANPGDEAETTAMLEAAQIDSGLQIARMGRLRFLQEVGATPESRALHAKATFRASAALVLATDRHPNAMGAGIDPTSALHFAAADGDDDWDLHPISLEGGGHASGLIGYADYEAWRTIFSPLAYLADLLRWIDERGGLKGADNLQERRPDIAHIHLSEATTFTVVPQLTIALEVLEVAAARRFDAEYDPFDDPLRTFPRAPGESDTSAYLFARAYEGSPSLANTPWPIGAPFALAPAQIDAYLRLIGLSRWRLMRDLRSETAALPPAAAIDGAALGLPQALVDALDVAIDDTDASSKAWAGLGPSDTGLGEPVAPFMLHFGLSLDEVRALVRHRGLHPSGATQRPLTHIGAAWSFDDLEFAAPWGLADCQRVARFVRLSRATGWTLHETDLAARPCLVDDATPVNLDLTDLSILAGVRAVQGATGLPLARLHGWWADLDTFGPSDDATSPYAARFLRRLPGEVATIVDDLSDPAPPHGLQLTADRTEVAAVDQALSFGELRAAVRGALSIDDVTLERLVAHINQAEDTPAEPPMELGVRLGRLSAVARWVDLADWLGLPAARLLDLSAHLADGAGPFDSPWTTHALIEAVQAAAKIGLPAAALADLVAPPSLGAMPERERTALSARLAELRHNLREVRRDLLASDARPEAETWEGRVRLLLAEVLEAEALDKAVTALGEADYSSEDNQLDEIAAGLPDGDFDPEAVEDAIDAVAGDPPERDEQRADILVEAVRDALVMRRSRRIVADAVAADLGDGDDLAPWAGGLPTIDETPRSLIGRLLDPDFVGEVALGDPAPTTPGEGWAPDDALMSAWRGAARVVRFARACGLGIATLDWLEADPAKPTFLRPAELLDPPSEPSDRLTRLLTTIAWAEAERGLPRSGPAVTAIHDTSDESTYHISLAERLGWLQNDVAALANALGLALDEPGRQSAEVLIRLATAAGHLRRLGAGPGVIADWRHAEPTLTTADAVTSAVRHVVGTRRWAQAAQPIEGALWRARRNALVAVLSLTDEGTMRTADELYEHLLIDPLVEPCGKTSRVRDAIAATQHYIQRWMLGLEPQAPALTEDDRADWRWMKTYRVWEAARRVFLYPENWLRPELRRDTSPEFDRLASSLGAAELTDEEVERAYLGYLQELHEIGNLEVVSHFDEQLAGGTTSGADLHVIGRTPSNPPRYYYRARVEGRWEPWESLDLGIEGVHVMIARHLGRLMLMWPTFTPKPVTRGKGENATQVPRTEIAWHWSIRGANGWSKPEMSRETSLHMHGREFSDQNYDSVQFRIEAATTQGSPELRLWLLVPVGHRAGWLGSGPAYWAWNAITDGLERRIWGAGIPDRDHRMSPADGTPRGSVRLRSGTIDLGPQAPDGSLLMSMRRGFAISSAGFSVVEPRQVWNFAHTTPFVLSTQSRSYLLTRHPEDRVLIPTGPSGNPLPNEGPPTSVQQVHASLDSMSFDQLEHTSSDVGDTQESGPSAASPASLFDGTTVAMYSGQISASQLDLRVASPRFSANLFFHPHTGWLIERIRSFGLLRCLSGGESEPALDGLHQQTLTEALTAPGLDGKTWFERSIAPVDGVFPSYPTERFAFERSHPLAPYNWELFFHIPMLIADRFRQAGDFEAALRWYQTIFDPTAGTPNRRWRFGPFAKEPGDEADRHFDALVDDPEADPLAIGDLTAALAYWARDPFDAHRAASVRSGALRRWVVREYIETLIVWGDDLFTRYTAGTVAEARQLYVLASGLLGRRPIALPPPPAAENAVVGELLDDGELDHADSYETSESWVSIDPPTMGLVDGLPSALPGTSDFFGIPFNDHLLRLWDTVADRLFKIRNCLNIDGEAVPLALFDPPIDPAALVGAGGRGADLASALRALGNPLPHHRFSVTWQRAVQVAGSVKALGGALLSALEKRDGEALGRLRAEHEVAMQDRMIEVRRLQVAEAEQALDGIERSRALTEQRLGYFEGLIEAGLNVHEIAERTARERHHRWTTRWGNSRSLSAIAEGFVPNATFGVSGFAASPVITATLGPAQVSALSRAAAALIDTHIMKLSASASESATLASQERRQQDWQQQVDAATAELKQLDAQLTAARTRIEIASRELDNARLAREHSATSLAFMREKFTNTELYHWMATELSALYFQTWRLAFDLAMRAEACFRLETAQPTARFIRPDAWDASKRGLLAGEKLGHDLERMDIAYAEQDRREYELTKAISLSEVDGIALERLRHDGFCFFYLPEALFDQDGPGHYLRRMRQVTVSIACVSGASAMVHGKLTLMSSKTRRVAGRMSGEDPVPAIDDGRAPESIVTSRAQEDTGTFGGQDGRYQPFEYRGVVDTIWKLELLDRDMPTFEHLGITDVNLTIAFTARDGGEVVASEVREELAAALSATGAGFGGDAEADDTPAPTPTGEPPVLDPPLLVVSARQDFPDAWHAFLHPDAEATSQVLKLDLASAGWQHAQKRAGIEIAGAEIVIVTSRPGPMLTSPPVSIEVDYEETHLEHRATLNVVAGSYWQAQPQGPIEAEDGEAWTEELEHLTSDSVLSLALSGAEIEKFDAELREDVGEGGPNWRFKPDGLQDLLVILRYKLTTS